MNTVYPKINSQNIYDHLIKLINNISNEADIILVYVTCGSDDRFIISENSENEFDRIRNLLDESVKHDFDLITEKYKDKPQKKLFYVNELIWPFFKLRWTPTEILNGQKTLFDGTTIDFSDTVKKNKSLLLQYYVMIGKYPVGIDVATIYDEIDLMTSYQSAADYKLQYANYQREYYYMLFPFKHYFRQDNEISQELETLIEHKFGLYKQLMVRIETYEMLYNSGNLDIKNASLIVASILSDIKKIPNFTSSVENKIKEVSMNNTPEIKIKEWNDLLSTLYDEINAAVNARAKKYFFKFLELLPKEIQEKYYLPNLRKKISV